MKKEMKRKSVRNRKKTTGQYPPRVQIQKHSIRYFKTEFNKSLKNYIPRLNWFHAKDTTMVQHM